MLLNTRTEGITGIISLTKYLESTIFLSTPSSYKNININSKPFTKFYLIEKYLV